MRQSCSSRIRKEVLDLIEEFIQIWKVAGVAFDVHVVKALLRRIVAPGRMSQESRLQGKVLRLCHDCTGLWARMVDIDINKMMMDDEDDCSSLSNREKEGGADREKITSMWRRQKACTTTRFSRSKHMHMHTGVCTWLIKSASLRITLYRYLGTYRYLKITIVFSFSPIRGRISVLRNCFCGTVEFIIMCIYTYAYSCTGCTSTRVPGRHSTKHTMDMHTL